DLHRVDGALLEARTLVDGEALHHRAFGEADGPLALEHLAARVEEGLRHLGEGEVAVDRDAHRVRADRERGAGLAALIEAATGQDAELRRLGVAGATGIGEAARPVVPEVRRLDARLAGAEDHALALREPVAASRRVEGELARAAVDVRAAFAALEREGRVGGGHVGAIVEADGRLFGVRGVDPDAALGERHAGELDARAARAVE